MHHDLDPGLVLVVPASDQVIGPQDGLKIGQQVTLADEFPDCFPDHRGTAKAATNQYFKADLASFVASQGQPDVMHLDGGAVVFTAGYRNLELAGQEREFGMQG